MNHYLAAAAPFPISDVFHPAKIFPTQTAFGQLASYILFILTAAAGIMAFFFIILAGFKFVTSGGDPKKLAGAQGTLTYAIIGIVVTILAFVILQVVQFMLRSNVPVT